MSLEPVKHLVENLAPVPLNDLSRTWIATSEEVRSGLARVIASGWFILGPELEAFERELASYLRLPHAVGVANGTDALALALLAVGCDAGSEVVTAANAGGYTSIAAARLGCGVVYADVDPNGLVMSPETVDAALGPSTRAVVVTHLYGNVADINGIIDVCRPRGVAVVEDCAQALGAVHDGQRVGSFGDAAAFSFYPTKNLGGAGDGGAVTTNDASIADSVRSLRQYGWGNKYAVERRGGMNSRLDELQAVILRIGLHRLDDMTATRQVIVRGYREVVQGTQASMVSGSTPSFVAHLAVARFPAREQARAIFRSAGIATDIHYPIPDHQQPALPAPIRSTPLIETERAAEEILTIPCFPELTPGEIERVRDTLGRAAVA